MQVFSYSPDKFAKIATNPDLDGILVILPWIDVESQRDSFNFDHVDSILDAGFSYHKKVIFQFQIKSFQGAPPVVPAYLLTDPTYLGGVAYAPDSSSMAKLWIPAVTNRLDTVLQALGNHIGQNPALEGFNFNETAAYGWWLPEYDVHDYMDGIKASISHARSAFSDSVFIVQYLNWLPGSGPLDSLINNLREIADYTTTFPNTGFGGPDNKIQHNPPFTKVMPFQHEYDQSAVLMNATQWADYGYINPNTGDPVTAAEILEFSVDSLKDDYVVWLEREPFFTQDVLPTLAAYHGLCPDSMQTATNVSVSTNGAIYPNPFSGRLNIEITTSGPVYFELYDFVGRKQISSTIQHAQLLKTGHLPPGLYMATLKDRKGHLLFQKLLIKQVLGF